VGHGFHAKYAISLLIKDVQIYYRLIKKEIKDLHPPLMALHLDGIQGHDVISHVKIFHELLVLPRTWCRGNDH
jgi:signal recognition particle GTPase